MTNISKLSFVPSGDGFTILPASQDEILPDSRDVRLGISYGDNQTGNLHLPAEAAVSSGTGFGAAGTEFTGTLVAQAEPPAIPVLSFEGVDDSGLAQFTVSGSDNESENTFLVSDVRNSQWVERGRVIGNDALGFYLAAGSYWVQLRSTTNNGTSYSTVLFVGIPSEISDYCSEVRLLLRTALLGNEAISNMLGTYQGVFYKQQPYDAVRPWICFEMSDPDVSAKGGHECRLSVSIYAKTLSQVESLSHEARASLANLPMEGEQISIRRIIAESVGFAKNIYADNWTQKLEFAVHLFHKDQTVNIAYDGASCTLPGLSPETRYSLQRLQSVARSAGGTKIINDHGSSDSSVICTACSLLAAEYQSFVAFYNSVRGSSAVFSFELSSEEQMNVSFSDKEIVTERNMDGTVDVAFELWIR